MTAALIELRHRLMRAGYSPIPLFGKVPPAYGKNNARKGLGKWQTLGDVSYDQIEMWAKTWPDAINTGVLTRLTPALDLDLLNEDAAVAAEDFVRERYEEGGYVLTRIGRAPKRAILFRTIEPFAKILVNLVAPNGAVGEKIEFLADGQQVVVDGIHPETQRPYSWHGGSPGEIPREELPYIREAEARALVAELVDLLVRDFGYHKTADRPGKQTKERGDATTAGGVEDWSYLTANILAGRELHDSLRDLAAKMVTSGTNEGAVVNHLRGLMDASGAPHDQRWLDRRSDIPRLVDGAAAKYRETPYPEQDQTGGQPGDQSGPPSGDEADAATQQQNAQPSGLGEWDAGDDTLPPPPRGWLLGTSFARKFLSSILGDGAVGKSALRYAQALSLASGKPLTGEHVFQRGRVLILSLEDDADELRRRILAACLHSELRARKLQAGCSSQPRARRQAN